MEATVVSLSRYPVKGLSAEPLASVQMEAGRGVPGDRVFALALPGNAFDEANPTPKRKTEFLMLAREQGLARLKTSYDATTGLLTVRDGDEVLEQDVRAAEGRSAIQSFFARFLPDEQRSLLPRIVTAPNHCFTDVGVHSAELMHAVSLLNLASLRELEARINRPLDPRRFRANILVEGLDPWVELNWLDRELEIGPVRLRGARLTRRCPATEVNPDTALRDINVPQELMRTYGHIHLGLYVHVLRDGIVSIGDRVGTPPS